ncbi:MAG: 23S rRNA (guanosine(2251)-2'-O)-methyltransferase RlmB [Anaerolineae bacterium]|nr:23S rRNA (guanosine(2251)-2'-O)-methyltransferase RlmB [Thermoflexales bacterium]MDW8408264.1 23S rRNA (guanosine(2251)-2'-O)-methyltransferase RlmB [Anaerolineae bacterium]
MTELLYGRHAVLECLRAGRRSIHRVLLAEGVKDAPILRDIVALARSRHVPIFNTARQNLDRISDHHQGIAVEVGAYPYSTVQDMLALAAQKGEPPLLLILDALQDPQNFGNLIRTVEAAGAHGIIIPQRRSVAVTPAVVNASAGATEHVSIAQVVNLAREVEALKARDVWIAALQDDPRAQELYAGDLRGALALIVGSEGEGVSRLLRERADFLFKLPMRGRIESLNASVAGAVALYEILRQRLPAYNRRS